MRILQVSAEMYPWLKTGGLADVAGALPGALHACGCDVRVLLPGFPAIVAALQDAVPAGSFVLPWGETATIVCGVLQADPAAHAHTAYALVAPGLYERPGGPYEDPYKRPFDDNHRRFAALGWAAAELAYGLDGHWRADLVHSHDWHAALSCACLAYWPDRQTNPVPSVYTVHNLAYQGLFPQANFGDLGLPGHAFGVHGLEFYGQVSFMKAGLACSSHITTVSPSYALEIQTQEQGCGLDGLLRERSAHLSGILNGVDSTVWNPTTDPLIAQKFGIGSLLGKGVNKARLQSMAGLEVSAEVPLFALVSRLTEQKGLPLVLQAVDALVSQGGQLLVLGSGDKQLEDSLVVASRTHPGKVAVRLGYDETFAHQIFAGSDVTLVPSRFEPCGLTQMYGMQYGSLPLVHRVGGLADTVVDTDLETLDAQTATGFSFDGFTAESFSHALRRAFALYRRPADWNAVRHTGMALNLDWTVPAAQYASLYRRLVRNAVW